MAFDALPVVPRVDRPGAMAYSERAIELSREAAMNSPCVLDIPYGGDSRQQLDVYQPGGSTSSGLPVLMMVHGGRWSIGIKEWMGYFAPAVTAFPAILVSATHRQSPEFKFPALAEDIAAAVAWVHGHITEYGGDPARIYLGGHSSGAHLAALVTLRKDFTAAHGLPEDIIKGCFPISGTFDLDYPDPDEHEELAAIMDSVFANREDAPLFSPINYVAGNKVPFYIVHGSRDFGRIKDSSGKMAAALEDQPCRTVCDVFEGLDHFEMGLETRFADHPWMCAVREWLTGGGNGT